MSEKHPRDRWRDVQYLESGRAKPLGVAGEGEPDHVVLEKADGKLEIREPTNIRDIQFENRFSREEAEIPVREIAEALHGEQHFWSGSESIPVTLVFNPPGFSVVAIELEENIGIRDLEDLGIIGDPNE